MEFWTEPRFTAGFAIRLLSILRDDQGRYLTLELLTDRALGLLHKNGKPPEDFPAFSWWLDFAEKLLRDCAALGLVQIKKGERPTYRGIFSIMPPEGGGRDGGDGDGDGAPAGGDGGSGMSEVLSNRVLFALDDEAFDAAIQRSLEAY